MEGDEKGEQRYTGERSAGKGNGFNSRGRNKGKRKTRCVCRGELKKGEKGKTLFGTSDRIHIGY